MKDFMTFAKAKMKSKFGFAAKIALKVKIFKNLQRKLSLYCFNIVFVKASMQKRQIREAIKN
jgi:hypothetical protein